jgi:alpha,alpha-trehalase
LLASGKHLTYHQISQFFLGMNETVRDILSNFIYIVRNHEFIPNGGRIYYKARSQPPMLIPMFYEYLEATGDFQFVQDNLDILEKVNINFVKI